MQFVFSKNGRRRRAVEQTCRSLTVMLLIFMLLPGQDADAVEMTSLYTVEVPLDVRDPDARDNAYREALTIALIRATGSTAAAESAEFAELFPNPARYVLQYSPGPDDTLVVSFDGAAIERILRQSGATIWDSNRPLTLILLGVDWGQGDREIVAADVAGRPPGDSRFIDRNRLLRERVQQVATMRGLPIVFPILDTEELESLSFTDIWGGFDDQLMESAARYGANSVLVGRIRPDSMLEQRWTWYHLDQRRDWSGEPEQAINFLGDALANQYAVGGDSQFEDIRLTISGVTSLTAYGKIQQFMENIRGVDNLAVISATADSITYGVSVQGGSERLARTLEASGLLDPVSSGSNAIDSGASPRNDDPFAEDADTFRPPETLEYLFRSG